MRRPCSGKEVQRTVLVDLAQVRRRIQEPLRTRGYRPRLGAVTMMHVYIYDRNARARLERLRRSDRCVSQHAEPAAARGRVVALAHRVVPRRPHEHERARARGRVPHCRERGAGGARCCRPRARSDRRRTAGHLVDAALAEDASPQNRRQPAAPENGLEGVEVVRRVDT